MRVSRRAALGLFGAGALAPAAASAAEAVAVAFAHGVASGDPTARGAILWTRVTPPAAHNAAVPVTWHVAENGRTVETGTAEARPARDFTVKVEPTTLRPGRDYTYWFEANGIRSPAGRFRTLPQGRTADAVFAVVSCQNFPSGFYNAYAAVAKLERLDAILHLGDYIYEYGRDGYGGATGRKIGREVEPAHEIVTLADYRTRHAQYKSDPDLQAAHARAAMIAVWDDHETANDSFVSGAENHQPTREGDWARRKAAAMQAYFEWMPIRDPVAGRPWEAINRSFQFGDLATVAMVETRLLARSQQADQQAKDPAAVLAIRNDPAREMLGPEQRGWLEGELAASVKAGKPWQVLGNQVVMARVPGPIPDQLLPADRLAALNASPYAALVAHAVAGYRAGLPFNLDSWDGYPPARERLYESFRRAGSRPIVLSGDSHAFWANALADAQGRPVASEFGTSGITSPSNGDSLPGLPLGALLEAAGEEVVFCDQNAKGFIVLTLTPERAVADYRAVSTILEKAHTVSTLARFEVSAADRALRKA
ncbi:alkaline phosphatase D family protein [Sphingomonas aracearum]|uniref:Alkaline phosphatase n=1 Tax=Sphingomonas aracearum TaxID=2283317 RepID=A0A369VXZ4_9SPHN|nr:alkaline phosphatase D family protein [Sphingomonas aracearum]RDE07256.1 alkaline phosphatase [Sphingomonas aracearum]